MTPADLDIWMQRGGRGGRGGSNLCRCTLLVEPSALERRRKAPKHPKVATRRVDEDYEVRYEGDEDEDVLEDTGDTDESQVEILSTFISTAGCLWNVVDEYYGNPLHEGK